MCFERYHIQKNRIPQPKRLIKNKAVERMSEPMTNTELLVMLKMVLVIAKTKSKKEYIKELEKLVETLEKS